MPATNQHVDPPPLTELPGVPSADPSLENLPASGHLFGALLSNVIVTKMFPVFGVISTPISSGASEITLPFPTTAFVVIAPPGTWHSCSLAPFTGAVTAQPVYLTPVLRRRFP